MSKPDIELAVDVISLTVEADLVSRDMVDGLSLAVMCIAASAEPEAADCLETAMKTAFGIAAESRGVLPGTSRERILGFLEDLRRQLLGGEDAEI